MTPLDLTKSPPRSPSEELAGLIMLPRMIDIARAKLPGGAVGEYQIGRGMSGVVLKHFRLTADEFIGIVARANDDDEVLATLPGGPGQTDHSKLSSFLKGLRVADVPDPFKAEFQSFYGKNLPADRLLLDVLEEENLQQHALRVGEHLTESLRALQTRHALIGDVRGSGLFLGIDLVLDRESREAAPLQASYVVNRLRDCGILAGTDGPHHNVIKLRPPLVFSEADADLFVKTLDGILQEDPAQPSG